MYLCFVVALSRIVPCSIFRFDMQQTNNKKSFDNVIDFWSNYEYDSFHSHFYSRILFDQFSEWNEHFVANLFVSSLFMQSSIDCLKSVAFCWKDIFFNWQFFYISHWSFNYRRALLVNKQITKCRKRYGFGNSHLRRNCSLLFSEECC